MDYLSTDVPSHELKQIIEICNKTQKAIKEKDYNNYSNCVDLGWKLEYCMKRGYQETIDEIQNRLIFFRNKISKILDNSYGTNLGDLSETLEDLEECMKLNNFYDFYFLETKARNEIEEIGYFYNSLEAYNDRYESYVKNFFYTKNVRRRMTKKVNDYKNLILQFHPRACLLWEHIRHNLAMEENGACIADAQNSLAEANWEIANNSAELIEVTRSHVQATLSISDSIGKMADTQEKLLVVYASNALATLGNMGANLLIADELNTLKKIQMGNTIINAFEAWQLNKIQKKLLGE